MTAERKFYRTRISFDVLSEEPIHPFMDIDAIVLECDEGAYVMADHEYDRTDLTGAEMARALVAAGSTPDFFMLDDHGNPLQG